MKISKNALYLFTAFLFIITMACTSTSKLATTTPILSETAFLQLPSTKPGSYDTNIKLTNGHPWPILLHIPATPTTQPRPLILALHWAGPPATYQEYASCLAIPALKHTSAIIVAPSSENVRWWESEGASRIENFIQLAKKYWPIDSTKILLTGYSNGGTGSVALAQQLPPGTLSAIIPIAGSYPDLNKLTVPAYFIHGNKDELFDFESTRYAVDQAMRKNEKIKFITASGKSHYQACSYVSYLRAGIDWVKKNVWKE